jgi:hypothetical protein
MGKKNLIWATLISILMLLPICLNSQSIAADMIRPFLAADPPADELDQAREMVITGLAEVGLDIVGEYSPYKGVAIIATTNDQLKNNAVASEFGSYGAVLRFSLTETPAGLQFACQNPTWMANSFRLKNDLSSLTTLLGSELGLNRPYGSEDGKSSKELRKYHYMMMMPYFDDQLDLAEFSSQDAATNTVVTNLEAGSAGCSLVYRIDLSNGDVLLGVGISEGKGADQTVMETVDFAELRQSAHLPYEMLIHDGKAYALHAKFRIANSFPDLTMGTFMKIVSAPGAIEESLKAVCGQ